MAMSIFILIAAVFAHAVVFLKRLCVFYLIVQWQYKIKMNRKIDDVSIDLIDT